MITEIFKHGKQKLISSINLCFYIYIAEYKLYQVKRAYIIRSDGTSRVSGDKLELHVYLAEQILVVGLKSRARGLVKRQSQQLAIVEYLSSAIAPSDLEILVQIAGRGRDQ